MNNRDATIAGLVAVGYTQEPIRSSKYLAFAREDVACDYLVGKSGALRKKPCGGPISTSSTLTGGRFHRALREVGRHAAQYSSTEQAQNHLLELIANSRRNDAQAH